MRRNTVLLITSALLISLVSCQSSTSSDSSVPSDSTVTSDSSVPASGTMQIEVTVGVNDFSSTDGSQGTFEVPLGASVQLFLTDPTANGDFHLHGYDLEAVADKGMTATIAFTADQSGEFDVESHTTESVVAKFVVK